MILPLKPGNIVKNQHLKLQNVDMNVCLSFNIMRETYLSKFDEGYTRLR